MDSNEILSIIGHYEIQRRLLQRRIEELEAELAKRDEQKED